MNTALILINVSIFIYHTFFLPGGGQQLYAQLGFIPYEFSHFKDIGPRNLLPIPFTLFTSMFLHGGWLHLLSNMLYLWIFGDNVEDLLGHFKYLLFYILCGLAATLAHGAVNLNSQIPLVGASGAIAGVLGAYMFLFPGARIRTLVILVVFISVINIPAVIILGYWIMIQIISGWMEFNTRGGSGIAWFAHIGGFITGFIFIILLKKTRKRPYLRKTK